jgi:hypothetical protein
LGLNLAKPSSILMSERKPTPGRERRCIYGRCIAGESRK